ncbi:potassium-transporting ATPase subunit F [Nocardioides sp. P5_E3]
MSFSSSLLVVAVVLIALYVLAALIFPERFE